MPRVRVSITLQIVGALFAGVLLFGAAHAWAIRSYVLPELHALARQRAEDIAEHLEVSLRGPLLVADLIEVDHLLRVASKGTGLSYALVTDESGALVASTFAGGVPRDLLRPDFGESGRLVKLGGTLVRDVTVGVAQGRLGKLRLGLREDAVGEAIWRIEISMFGMVLAFLVLGSLAAVVYGRYLTQPLHVLVAAFERFQLDLPHPPLTSRRNDELGELTRSVEQTLARLKESHRELATLHAGLRETERLASIGVLAAGVAHEINNPLAGIRSALRRINAAPERVQQTLEYTELMLESTANIEEVVRSLLDLARRRPAQARSTDLVELVERARRLCNFRAERSSVSFEIRVQPEVRLSTVDPGALLQVLVNLILNAIDALSAGGQVTIIAVRAPPGLSITVEDNGPGIAPEIRAHLMEPFVTTKDAGKGTGLGLSVSRMLLEEQGGELRIESELGHGTRATLLLPAEPLS